MRRALHYKHLSLLCTITVNSAHGVPLRCRARLVSVHGTQP